MVAGALSCTEVHTLSGVSLFSELKTLASSLISGLGEWMITCRRRTSQHLSCEGKGQQATSAHPYVQTSCLTPNWKRLMGSFFLKRRPWLTIDGPVVTIRVEAVAKATWRCKFTPSSRERPCFRFGGALIKGDAAGDSGFKHRQQHHTLQQLRCVFLLCFYYFISLLMWEFPTLRRKSLLSWGFQFATVHSWWVIPGTYFFKTKNKLHFNIIFMNFDIKV